MKLEEGSARHRVMNDALVPQKSRVDSTQTQRNRRRPSLSDWFNALSDCFTAGTCQSAGVLCWMIDS